MRYRFLSKKASRLCLFIGLAMAATACFKEPNYPPQPAIEFEDISKSIRLDQFSGDIKDSVTITVKFQDGDGDLGLNETEKAEAQKNADYNYVVRSFRKVRGVFKEFNNSSDDIPFSGFFFRLKYDDKPAPIEGELSYSIDFPQVFIPKRDTVMFQIYVKDRSGNLSNTIETDPIVLND